MIDLYSLSPQDLAILSTVLGIELTKGLTPDKQNVLGNFIVSVGTTIFVIASQSQHLQSLSNNNNNNNNNNDSNNECNT